MLIQDSSAVTSSRKSTTAKVTVYNPYAPNGTDIGSVYVGSYRGTAAFAVMAGQKLSIPIYINCGMQQMEGLDISVYFDLSILRFDTGMSYFNFEPSTENVRIVGVVEYNKTYFGIPKVAELKFTALKSGTANPHGSANALVDIHTNVIPSPLSKPAITPCTGTVMGDTNKDCKFDIADAALIQTYIRESLKGFSTTFGQQLFRDLTQQQKTLMDVNKNGVTDYSDAHFLSKVLIGHAKHFSSITVATPNSKLVPQICSFTISTSLKNTDGTPGTGTRVFVALSNSDAVFMNELQASNIQGNISYDLNGGSQRYGKVVKLALSNTGNFDLISTKSTISRQSVGITLVQVVTTPSGKIVTTSTYKHAAGSTGQTNVTVDAGIVFKVSPSYQPQIIVDFTQTSSICLDPPMTQHMRITFPNDYDAVVKGKENDFTVQFTVFIETKYTTLSRTVKASNVTVRKGSVIVEFDLETKQSLSQGLVNDLVTDIRNGLTFNFHSNQMRASESLLVDGEEKIFTPGKKPDDDDKLVIIIVVVVSLLIIIVLVIVLILVRRRRRQRNKLANDVIEITKVPSKTDVAKQNSCEKRPISPAEPSGLQNPVYIYSSTDMLQAPPSPVKPEPVPTLTVKETALTSSEPHYVEPDRTETPAPVFHEVALIDVSQDEKVYFFLVPSLFH